MTATKPLELACFELGGRTVGLEVGAVREVVRARPATPLPQAPPAIEGVIDLRNRVLPVLDLGLALGGPPAAVGPQARIAVVEVDGLAVGLRVDAARGVVSIEAERIEPAPPLVARAGCDAVQAVVRRDGAPILVLSLERVLAALSPAAGREAEVGA